MLTENYPANKTKLFHKNLSILSKPSNKTSQEDGLSGPVPCLMCFQSSLVSWSFFSPPPSWQRFGAPLPYCPKPGRLQGGKRHHHGQWTSSCALLTTRMGGQGAAIYIAWLSPGLLGFLVVFSCANWMNKGKDVGLLCWRPYWF